MNAKLAIDNSALLIKSGLLIKAPWVQKDLLSRIPQDLEVKSIEIVNAYDTRDTDNSKASCAKCRRKNNHQKGFTVLINGKITALYGNNCGEKEFGHDAFRIAMNEFEHVRNLAVYNDKVGPMLKNLTTFNALIDDWLASAIIIDGEFQRFRSTFPKLADTISNISQKNNALLYETEKKVLVRDKEGDEKYQTQYFLETCGNIPFIEMFKNPSLKNRLLSLGRKTREIEEKLKDEDIVSNLTVLKNCSKEIKNIKTTLGLIKKQHINGREAGVIEQYKKILKWTLNTHQIEGAFKIKGLSFIEKKCVNTNSRFPLHQNLPFPPEIIVEH